MDHTLINDQATGFPAARHMVLHQILVVYSGKGIYVRVHPKSMKKFKDHLREYSSRKRCQSIRPSLEKIKVYARGWMNYYSIASMKNPVDKLNGWLY